MERDGRFVRERSFIVAISLTIDCSILYCVDQFDLRSIHRLRKESWSAQFRHLHRLEIAIFMDVYRQIDFDFGFCWFRCLQSVYLHKWRRRHARSVLRMWNYCARENMCLDYFRLWMSIWCTQGHVRNVNQRMSVRTFEYKAANVNIFLYVHVNSFCMQTIPICILKPKWKTVATNCVECLKIAPFCNVLRAQRMLM